MNNVTAIKPVSVATRRMSIWDMDGTIVDSSHRYRTVVCADGIERIDLQYWRDNEPKAMSDSLLPLHGTYAADLADPNCFVIVATARVMHEADWQFVREKLGKPDAFISRADGDTRSGGLLKVNGLQRFFNLKQFQGIDCVFYEDNVQYLKTVCDHFGIRGVYVPSNQGH
jgi:phosphoglycolate phosphatase-like HAD superfamily hydrolase